MDGSLCVPTSLCTSLLSIWSILDRIRPRVEMCIPYIKLEPKPRLSPPPISPCSSIQPAVRIVAPPVIITRAPLPPRIITRAPRRRESSSRAVPLYTIAKHPSSCDSSPNRASDPYLRPGCPPVAPTPPPSRRYHRRSSSSSSRSSHRLQEVTRRLAVLWRARARIEREKAREARW